MPRLADTCASEHVRARVCKQLVMVCTVLQCLPNVVKTYIQISNKIEYGITCESRGMERFCEGDKTKLKSALLVVARRLREIRRICLLRRL